MAEGAKVKKLLSGVGVTQAEACQNRDGAGVSEAAGGVAGREGMGSGYRQHMFDDERVLKRRGNLSSQPQLQFPLQFQLPTR